MTAISQAEAYAATKENRKRLIVTDGLRYGVYLKTKSKFRLHAYLNLTDLRSEYPIYDCHWARDALRAMTPDWNMET